MALITPFAQNGDKKAIPQNTSDGSVSFDRGFGSFYALPPEEGGLFIDRAQFNQLMFDTTSQVLENKQNINNLSGSTYNKSEVDNRLNAKIDSTKATKLLTENLVKTVGARGADFANLRQALEWASQYSYSGGRFTITLRCNTDMPIPGIYLPIGEAIIIIDGQNNSFNCDNGYFIHSISSGNHITIKNLTLNYNGITNNNIGCAFKFTYSRVSLENIIINVNNSTISNLINSELQGNLLIGNSIINCSGNTTINDIIYISSQAYIASIDLIVNTTSLSGQIETLFQFNNAYGNFFEYGIVKPPYPTDKINKQIVVYDCSLVKCGNRFNESKLSVALNTVTGGGIIFK